MTTVRAMAEHDGAAAATGLHRIVDGGPDAVFAACCVWAELVRQCRLPRRGGVPGGFYSWRLVDEVTGETVSPDSLGPALHSPVWATRFVMAVANHDMAMAGALLAVDADTPDLWWDNVGSLLALAAGAVRERAGR